jgi:sn-glycerol 3-phosphate transport system substrate-binding protein
VDIDMKKAALALAVLAYAAVLAACGGGKEGEQGARTPTGPVKIALWHSETAANQESIQRLVNRFNTSQSEVQVEVAFQGGYVDQLDKTVASLGTANAPNLILQDANHTQFLIDSGAVTPVQTFIDQEGYDLSDFDQKAVDFSTINGQLYTMPFTISVPMIFYNKVPFREVGLDPDHAPATLEEVQAASEKLLKKDSAGNVIRSGIVLEINDWYVWQIHALQGELAIDNGNGREGRPTEAIFNGPTGQRLFTWWNDMITQGLAYNVGRNPNGIDNFMAVASGRAVMTLTASSALRSVVDVLERGMEGIELGTGLFPGFADGKGGPQMAGLFLWILNGAPKEEQEAAWKLVKWLMEPEQQADWFAGSGYLPARQSAYDLPPAQQVMEQYPQFRQPVEAYQKAPSTVATQGPLIGPMAQVSEAIKHSAEEMVLGGKDPIEALNEAAATATQEIQDYEKRVKP